MNQRHAVIIGAGLGGLALSLRLAVQGWRITICEKGPTPGGKMNIFEKDGYRFDTGPSLVTLPWIFEDLFTVAGSRLSDHLTLERISPLAHYAYPDGTRFEHSTSLPDWLATIRNLEPRDVDGFWKFMGLGARLYELSARTFLSRSPYETPDIRDLPSLKHMPIRFGWGNYQKTVAAHFRSPQLRQLYNRYPTYVGSSPYQAPATLAVIPYIEWAFGGWYIKGGLYSLVKSIVDLVRRRGVELLTNAEVARISHRAGKTTGVELADGRSIPADVVVMNGDASSIPSLLGTKGSSTQSHQERSLSGVAFLVGLRKKLDGLHHHNVYFSADYEREFHQLFRDGRFPDDPTVYVNIPSRKDSSVAPAGGETLFVLANAPSNEELSWNPQETDEAWARVYDRLRKNGFPDIREEIVLREPWTPSRFARQYGMPGGAIYGLASHGRKTAFLRPSNKDRKIKGLYRVGGSSHPGGGTPMVLMSAKITSRLIAGDNLA